MNARSQWFLTIPVLAVIGCSDPTPLPNQASISLQIGGPNCPEPGKVYLVGKPAPTEGDPGASAVDGESGASVSCSVHGSGPYTFSGSLHAPSSENDSITVTLSDGVVAADKLTGTVSVGVLTPQLDSPFSSGSTPCTVTVINQQVKGGSIWADLSCPSLTSPPSEACTSGVAPSVSTFVLRNCDGL